MSYLPVSYKEIKQRNWDAVDFVCINGDAYVDHPSFGAAVITRVLENAGYRVGMLAQPDWKNPASVTVFGRPRLGFLVTSGNMDSLVNHYTVSKKRRTSDAYSPGGKTGLRPDRAVTVYCNLIRQAYKDAAIIIGGLEASLRRFAHYDYWQDTLKRSVLLDSGADILCYGMGEKSITEVADALNSGLKAGEITFIKGTAFKSKAINDFPGAIALPDHDALLQDKKLYAQSFMTQLRHNDHFNGKPLAEKYKDCCVVQNPPQPPLTTGEMDAVYALPYMRDYHPMYKDAGGVPAIEEIKFSITSSRGCFGSCNFCALAFHQGRVIQSRSHDSIIKEALALTAMPDFKGYIHDVGGPTANFRHPSCGKQTKIGVCGDKQCLFPSPCKNLDTSHRDYAALLNKLRSLPGVKKVFVRSGVRFDYVMAEKDDAFLTALCKHHISGQLKVAPEHVSDNVLRYMGKPESRVYAAFAKAFDSVNKKLGKKQYLVPYLMSSHPGSELRDAVKLAEYIRDTGYMPEQVQDFYPTPSTVSACMYYTHIDPRTNKPVYVADNPHEKAMQRALIQYKNPKNYALVIEALLKAGRADLIGFNKNCLIRPKERRLIPKETRSESREVQSKPKKMRVTSKATKSKPKETTPKPKKSR